MKCKAAGVALGQIVLNSFFVRKGRARCKGVDQPMHIVMMAVLTKAHEVVSASDNIRISLMSSM